MEMLGHWRWDEVYPASRTGWDMLESVDHTVDAIIDFRNSLGIPTSGITHARNMIGKRHPRTGVTILVGTNPLLANLWSVFNRVYGRFVREQEFTMVATLADAYQILKKQQNE
jgi:hypothetical protein